jgi:hypothetical protein
MARMADLEASQFHFPDEYLDELKFEADLKTQFAQAEAILQGLPQRMKASRILF